MAESAAVADAITLLTEAGYLVAKIPPCNRADHQHGRHGLVTRTAMCPGSDPLPHGFSGRVHRGSFGYLTGCLCGTEFPNYGPEGEPTPWERHEAQHFPSMSASARQPCREWLEDPREPQERCPCGHFAAVHTGNDACWTCFGGPSEQEVSGDAHA